MKSHPSFSISIKSAKATMALLLLASACTAPAPTALPRPSPMPGVTFVPAGTSAVAQAVITATPRPLGAPLLVDRSPVRGEALTPDRPLVLTFDQPMDKASVEKALSVKAADGSALSGAVEWTSDNVLRFTPAQSWTTASRYTIELAGAAKSAKGLGLARPETFSVSTIGKFELAQTLPADGAQDVAADDTITLLFNRPVVPLTALAEQANLPTPVRFEPAIAGKGVWLNTSIYVFQPAAALAAGITYNAIIPADLRDSTGAALETERRFSFTVAPPVVTFVSPSQGSPSVRMLTPIDISFSQAMDHASTEAAFKIDPAVDGTFSWLKLSEVAQPENDPLPADTVPGTGQPRNAPRGEALRFIPRAPYARATRHTVTLASSAKAANGAALGAPFRSEFTTVPAPAIVSTEPAAGAQGANGETFTLRFSAPVSPATILRSLSFTPAISLTEVFSYYDDYSNQFNLNAQFKPSTAYRVNIAPGIADDFGAVMTEALDLRFTTGALQPFVNLHSAGLIGTYRAGIPSTVFASVRNVTELQLNLSRLSPAEYYSITTASNSFENLNRFVPAPESVVRSWTLQTSATLNQSAREKIALLPDNGALPPGLYLLKAEAPEVRALDPEAPPARQVLIVTNRQVALKVGARRALVWVTNLVDGQPVGGAPVRFFDKDFKLIGEAVTTTGGEQAGQAEIELPPQFVFRERILAFVDQEGAGFGWISSDASEGITGYDFDLPTRYQNSNYFAYLYTDRPIYRPGQMVYLKGVLRRDEDAQYSADLKLPGDKPTLTVSGSQGQTLLTETLSLSANGTFSLAFTLDDSAPSGYYNLTLCVPHARADDPIGPCDNFYEDFLVSSYRRPEFEVTLTLDKPDYLAGETISSTLAARYFFGGNVANAKVAWALRAADWRFDRYRGPGSYRFGDDDSTRLDFSFPEQIADGTGQTDANGNLTLALPADISARLGSAEFTLEVSVTDVNDQFVSARANAIVHKQKTYFGIAPRTYLGVIGQPQNVDIIAVDWTGAPVANMPGDVRYFRREWFTARIQDQYGNLEYSSTPSDTLTFSETITTDAEGRSSSFFVPETGGEFRAVVSSNDGVAGADSIYVSSDAYVGWRVDNNDRITLKADKPSYKVGESARILVPSPFQGPVTALLTIERGEVLERRNIILNSNSEVLEIPVDIAHVPNVYVSVLLVKGISGNDTVPAFKLGYTTFAVEPNAYALKIDVQTDKTSYGPRDTVVYNITVTDAQSQPVQAELSLAVVDKAVLSLTAPNSQLPLAAFYGTRELGVSTSDSLSINVDRLNVASESRSGGKGGGGGGNDLADGIFIRQNFKDTAFWSAVIETNADGKAQISVPLPDNLTTWTLDARAITVDSKVGHGANEVIASKPLLIRPVTPRFFVVGDGAVLGAVVNNNGDAPLEAEVTLEGSGLAFTGDTVQRVNVPARGNARVDWSVRTLDAEAALITFTVKSGALQDSSTPTLAGAPSGGIPIRRYISPETIATAGDVSEPGAKVEIIALPPRLSSSQGSLDVRIDTALGAAALKASQSLRAHPYESLETMASRLLVATTLPVTPESRPEIERALQRLFSEQQGDGGWGWYVGGTSEAAVSAYAVIAIANAQAAGYAYDANSLQRARDYLLTRMETPAEELPDAGAANQRALILFALGEAGTPDSGRLGSLYESRAKLGHYGTALLAMSLERAQPGDPRVKTLLADLAGGAITSATGAHWEEAQRDYANFFGNTRSTAVALLAMTRLDAKNALNPNIVRWLMNARTGDWWETPHETAWNVLALSAWIKFSGDASPKYAWRVALNESNILQGDAGTPRGAGVDQDETTLGFDKLLRDQSNPLVFERGTGAGRLYYSARLRIAMPVESAQALDRGIIIARKYERASCAPTLEQPCEAISSAKIGEEVRVRLTVIAPNDLNFVRIIDALPAGAEAIDTSLRTSQSTQATPEAYRFGGRFGWGWWWFVDSDIQDDSVTLSASSLPAGAYEYTYVIRPSIVGEFKVIPALAEQAYMPDVFGRSDGALFKIER